MVKTKYCTEQGRYTNIASYNVEIKILQGSRYKVENVKSTAIGLQLPVDQSRSIAGQGWGAILINFKYPENIIFLEHPVVDLKGKDWDLQHLPSSQVKLLSIGHKVCQARKIRKKKIE